MQKRILYITTLPIISLFLFKLLTVNGVQLTDENNSPVDPQHRYGVHSLPIPGSLNFAGEPVPIDNFDIRERFDRELLVNSYWQSQTLMFFKRANRWFKEIEPILAEEGIPDDFKYLALIESGLMNVQSPAGAAGFWQILQTTGRELGLEVNDDVDERYHLENSTRAAAKFLHASYAAYDNWTSAAASYNMGRSGLSRQMTNQKASSYYDLWLNEETSRYVFRILAIKTIFENPAEYGFQLNEQDFYPPLDYYSVKVDSTVTDLIAFAHHHQITYKELRTLNPWIRTSKLTNRSRKVYEIKITKESMFGLQQPIVIDEIPMIEEVQSPGRDTDL
jgi:membrane-bound lytic murein transglycosylase D